MRRPEFELGGVGAPAVADGDALDGVEAKVLLAEVFAGDQVSIAFIGGFVTKRRRWKARSST